MLRTRLWMGAVMALLGLGVLVVDHAFAPWYPILAFTVLSIGVLATHELRLLLPIAHRPFPALVYPTIIILLAANWLTPILPASIGPLDLQLVLLCAFTMIAFIVEVGCFRADGVATSRISSTLLIWVYVGLLGGALARLRWMEGPSPMIFGQTFSFGALSLAFAFFIPKAGDIGAYFFGHAFGRHRFAPLVSPKKTWEGSIGGFLGSVFATIGLAQLSPLFDGQWFLTILLGIIIAVMSQFGDLAESILKRDGNTKDASRTIPGFGGVLDVIDSILFAAPVALAGLWVIQRWVNS